MTTKTVKIDATGKKLGRLASEVAVSLLGKDDPNYAPHIVSDIQVEVENASKLDLGEKKLNEKEYAHYTGYPSGLKKETAGSLKSRKGASELVRKAVYGMLPGNKLRSRRMKRLVVTE